ncbi:zinc finger and BTB domain-containing protein 2-like [Scleropages formosus]|uniref:Zinc finger and BTB domain-containing protein 2-like n=1 Tax=Scleropages formosus TaxID=113540 RepID=A0A0P7U0H7_SCLFO|nr:zinc finger and BTB domain-containing protein 2-like [Scleropages formosus]
MRQWLQGTLSVSSFVAVKRMELANHGLILLQQLNAQREFGFLCDCTVAIGDVFFKAHKAVLAAFSNYFRMLFIHQDSDCVRLKPADIQPDIFSYLLNLMYTGKLAPQLIDPVRLEQGVKFLHAYPLLQEVSLTAFSHAEQGLPLAAAAAAAASLYGIQISDQQSGLSGQLPARSRLPSPFEPEALVDGRHEAEAVAGESPSLAEEHVQQVPAPNAILHVKPSIMKRSAHFRKLYTCHLCGSQENSPVEALFLASDRPYKCNVCEATFSSPGEVVKHLCFTQNVAGFRAADSPGLLPSDQGSDSSTGTPLDTAIKSEEIPVE